MLADQASHVSAVTAGFRTKTWSIGSVAQWKIGFVQNFVAMQICQRDLSGRHQIIRPFELEFEEIGLEFRQLPGPEERFIVDHKWRQHFAVPVFARVQIEHETDERPFEPCPHPAEHGKASPGHLGCPLLIQYSERSPDIDVISRIESFCLEISWCSPPPDFDIVRFILPGRNRFMRKIRHADQNRPKFIL